MNNNSNDSWSRCAREFVTSDMTSINEIQCTREFDESIMRPTHIKKLDFNNGFSSCRGLVATDIALANIEEVERNELVSKWIADGMCTPPTSEINTSCQSSPCFGTFVTDRKLDEESFYSDVLEKLEKSPIFKCRRKSMVKSKRSDESLKELTKSPIIGKRRRSQSRDDSEFSSLNRSKLNKSETLTPSDKSPILGKAPYSLRKLPRIKRKRLQDRLDFDKDPCARSYLGENQVSPIQRFPDAVESSDVTEESKVVEATDNIEPSQDIFDEEVITASPRLDRTGIFRNRYRERSPKIKREYEEDSFCSYNERAERLKNEDNIKEERVTDSELKHSPSFKKNNEYNLSLAIGHEIKSHNSSSKFIKIENKLFDSIIQDTEEFILPDNNPEIYHPDRNRSAQDDKFLILDSEFSIEKRKFVADTEQIDYDTSSENGEDNLDLKVERISIAAESDNDRTVSDLIEEPATQDCVEPSKPKAMISCSSQNSIAVPSPKISETISPKHSASPPISIVDISVETTPPRTQESLAPAPEILDSGKKKKSRPKKGSLGARLQKLISGQVSCVRLWRHQMSRESAFDRSSAPCTTLLVVEAWIEYGKDLYKSKVIDDPYDLLNDCFDESVKSEVKEENVSRNLVIMTNPDFVGSVKLLPGTVFKIYLPWEVFNRNSGPGNLILHALYFDVVSNPVKSKGEQNAKEFQASKNSSELWDSEVIREYDCPCLQNGKIDDSCLNKFTNCKIDVIAEIIK